MKQESGTKIQSTGYQINLVKIKDKTYFAYFPKQQNKQHLNEFIANDMQELGDIKYLRKLNKIESQSFYAFETYKEYALLSELKQLQEKVILKIFQDILIALFAIHQKGLLGRCFNVYNILIVENQHSVMMEYGFYPDLDYEVPEMIYNQIYNEKIDIFLLGRVIFYLMVGYDLPKFNLKNLSEVSSDINLAIAQTIYSEGLKKIVIQMLNIDVNKRIDYLQLIQKFKNNQFYPLQEQFYQQNVLKIRTQNIIEKRERNLNVVFMDVSTTFEIEQTGQLIKNFENSQGKTSLLQNNNSIQLPQKDVQSSDSLYPPELDEYQNYKSLNQKQIISKVTDSQPQTKPNKNTFEQKKFMDSVLSNDLVNLLPFVNSDRPSDLLIWNQIYFYLYRFTLMTKLIDEFQQNLQKCNNSYIISIAIYGMKKAKIILLREYLISLEQYKNLYVISNEEWEKFIQQSSEYHKMISKFKFDIDINQRLLLQTDNSQLKKVLDQYKNEGLLKDLYKFIQNYIEDNTELNNFENIKRPYRYILTNTLSIFDSQEDKSNSYVRLLIMMSILINKICDVQILHNHFKTICKSLNTDSIYSILQIEQFLKNGSKYDYIELYEELKECYFSS